MISRIETLTFRIEIDDTADGAGFRVLSNGLEILSGVGFGDKRSARMGALTALRDEWLNDIDDSMVRSWAKEKREAVCFCGQPDCEGTHARCSYFRGAGGCGDGVLECKLIADHSGEHEFETLGERDARSRRSVKGRVNL